MGKLKSWEITMKEEINRYEQEINRLEYEMETLYHEDVTGNDDQIEAMLLSMQMRVERLEREKLVIENEIDNEMFEI